MKLRWTFGPLALLLLIPALVACGPFGSDDDATITIGSKDFAEQLILGEIYAQLLEAHDFEVERSLNLGGTNIAHEALTNGDIDLYPEYTGTALLAILEMETMSDPDEVYRIVSEEYEERFDLIWMEQAPMNNTNALATSREFSEANNLTTISQMVAMADQIRAAVVPDFEEREDGLAGLKEVYGDFEFQELLAFDPGIKYQAFLQGDADVVQVFGTDGQIGGYDLVVLEDDGGLWPPYRVAPVVRQETLDENDELAEILNSVQPLLTSEVMTDMNWAVDGPDERDPEDVAREFLIENGLIDE